MFNFDLGRTKQRSPMIHVILHLKSTDSKAAIQIYASGDFVTAFEAALLNTWVAPISRRSESTVKRYMIRKGSKCAFWIGGGLFFRSWIFSSKLWVDQQAFLQDGKSVTIRFKWCWLVCRQTVSFTFSHFPAKWQVQLGGSSQLSDESMSWTNYQTERMWTQVNKYLQKYHQKSSNITWSYRVPKIFVINFSKKSPGLGGFLPRPQMKNPPVRMRRLR